MSHARRRLSVEFDDQAFLSHERSGTSRYFVELLTEFRANSEHGIDVLTPYKHIHNRHLAEYDPAFRRHALRMGRWRKHRPALLRAMNRPARSAMPTPDLVHHTDFGEIGLIAAWRSRRVCTFYDAIPERCNLAGFDQHLQRKEAYLRVVDGVICISESAKADLREFYPWFDKPVSVAPLAAPKTFADAIAGVGTPASTPERYFVFVGVRAHHKNAVALLEAFAQVKDRISDVGLVLVGAGLTEEERARLAESGITERVHVLGATDTELPAIYANAISLVHTSRHEGFGLPVVEAFAVGCPAILADTGIFREVAGDAAWFFDPDDTATLGEHLVRAAENPAARDALARAGRARSADFTWSRVARTTAEFYSEIAVDSAINAADRV